MSQFRVFNLPLLCCTLGLVCFGFSVPGQLAAQSFPSQPVRIVLGYPPGSTPDVLTRVIAEKIGEDLGQLVIVENRPGAGGIIAAEAVARAPADGYTLMVDGCSAAGIVYAFVMAGRPPLDPFRDFMPVGRMMRDHWVLAVSPALGVSSVNELIALGKSKPGALTFPSPGTGSSQHLQSERFRMRVGINALHVPYKDSPFPDLVAGRLSFSVQSSAAVAPYIKVGQAQGPGSALQPAARVAARCADYSRSRATGPDLQRRSLPVRTWRYAA